MLKQFKTTLQKFSQETLIRNNYKTVFLSLEIEKEKNNFKTERIKDYFIIQSWFAFKSEDYEEEWIPSIRIWDVWNNFDISNMVFLPEEYKKKYKNYLLKKDDIVVWLTWDWKLKADYVLEDDKYLLNQRVWALRKYKDYNLRFLYLLLDNSTFIKNQFLYLSNWKTQLNISPFDFLQIKIPNLPLTTQNEIVSKIEPIEQKIKELKSTIKNPKDVINEVFARDFGFDLVKFENLKKQKSFKLNFCEFANNIDVRQSVKFHRKAWKFVISELQKISNKKVKDFLWESIVLWTSVSPNDYDENWNFYYISMANIKNWKFESENSQLVSVEYSNKNQNKIVQKDDILIARSWEWTIWKVALIEDEEINWIFADFTMRIRLKNYNPKFAYYYFCTEYFQYLVEINKKWLWNNTNIFPSQIREFPIPDISFPDQQKIVDEIKLELDKQEKIKKDIEKERCKIDELIENSTKWI